MFDEKHVISPQSSVCVSDVCLRHRVLPAKKEVLTVLGQPPWYRRADKNKAISAQPSE